MMNNYMADKFIVIAGPANSGKLPLAKKLLADYPNILLIHRDTIRETIVNKMDEWDITLLMRAMAIDISSRGFTPLVVAWNLEPEDQKLWENAAKATWRKLLWLDTREPHVQAMIPPMEPSLDDI